MPQGCRTLKVAWRKGIQVISTPPAPVENAEATWDEELTISCVIFRGGALRESQAPIEAKFCWLEVIRDGEVTLGYAQLDLSHSCDSQVHFRELSVWKNNSPLGGFRLRVSIEATNSAVLRLPLDPAEPPPVRKASHTLPLPAVQQSAKSEENQPLPARSAVVAAPPALGTTQQPEPHPSASFPASSPRDLRVRAGAKLEAASAYATVLKSLPARLVMLCNRQCLVSGLNSLEQEDAIRLFISTLRQSREPLLSCGLLFSPSPPRTYQVHRVESSGTVGQVRSAVLGRPEHSPQMQPSDPHESAWPGLTVHMPGTPTFLTVASPGGQSVMSLGYHGAEPAAEVPPTAFPLPLVNLVPGVVQAVDAQPPACTRHLYDLMGHLSDIRSLSAALVPAELPVPSLTAPEVKVDPGPDATPLEPTVPAAAPETETLELEPASLLHILQTPQVGYATTPELRSHASPGASLHADGIGAPPHPDSPLAPHEHVVSGNEVEASHPSTPPPPPRPVPPLPLTSQRSPSPSGSLPRSPGSLAALADSFPPPSVAVLVSQIIRSVDQMHSLGEQAIKETSVELNNLLGQLQEVSRDREVWVHRFLAAREIQYASALCAQAARLDQALQPRPEEPVLIEA